MCGINGILSADIRFKNKITRLNELLSHRGPDDEGFVGINTGSGGFKVYSGSCSIPFIKEKYPHIELATHDEYDLVLGHRRLSIIDLTECGHGPMCDPSGNIWITYNGEIYNYLELRDELKALGHKFYSNSDTEVIINSYLQWGEECLNKFNGMWGFAIWDGFKKRMLLARDRFGVKPLYYIDQPGLFAFSSEIKPLVYLTELAELNKSLIPFFILFGNRLNSNESYIKGIDVLQPSHYLVYDHGDAEIKRYYDIQNSGYLDNSEEELCKKLESLLTDSVRLRFRSDVPVGTCLSGGFDSTSIVSISSDLNQKGLKTFSAVWSDKASDESKYIDIANNIYGSIPNKVEPKPEEFESVFNKLNYYQEIPSEGPGLIPQWYVMSRAKGEVKVLLDGQGGDEVFGGYFSTDAYLRSMIKDKNIKGIFTDFRKFFNYLNKSGIHSFSNWLFPRFYGNIVRRFSRQKYGILKHDLIKQVERGALHFDAEPPNKFKNYLNNLSYHYLTSVTIPTLLHYEDRSSMAFSIESRVPFLDYRLVEFGLNLKPEYLIRGNDRRYLFRKALGKRLPPAISDRKDKLGYPTPFANWSRSHLKDYINDTLLGSNAEIRTYLNIDQLKAKLTYHYSGKKDFSWDIWRFLSLENIFSVYKNLLSG